MLPKLYICDYEKNTTCTKSMCGYGDSLGDMRCIHTLDIEFALYPDYDNFEELGDYLWQKEKVML